MRKGQYLRDESVQVGVGGAVQCQGSNDKCPKLPHYQARQKHLCVQGGSGLREHYCMAPPQRLKPEERDTQ